MSKIFLSALIALCILSGCATTAVKKDQATYLQKHNSSLEDIITEASGGNVSLQHKLGNIYSTGDGVETNQKEAVIWWKKAALNGNAESQFELGIAYQNGQGIPKNLNEATFWYRQAAKQKHAEAIKKLTNIYVDQGREHLAFDYLKEAAKNGDASAHIPLTKIHLNKGDDAQAQKHIDAALASGNKQIYNTICDYYLYEKKDYKKALSWATKAEDAKYPDGFYYLYIIYDKGLGVEADIRKSQAYLEKARRRKSPMYLKNHEKKKD